MTDIVDEPGDVRSCAREIARRIAALAPLAVQGTKRALNHVTSLRAAEVIELAFELEERTLTSDDQLEGIAAFKEGRAANFAAEREGISPASCDATSCCTNAAGYSGVLTTAQEFVDVLGSRPA